MKTILYRLLPLLFGLNLHAQTRVDTTYYDSYGNTKCIHTIKISKGNKADVLVFNQNGQKTESYSLIDNKKHGKFISYSVSGKAMSIVNYHHDLKHGEEVVFFSNGKKKSSTEYAANYPFGEFRVWHESGILIQKGTYDTLINVFPNRPAETNQVLSGKYESYFQSGVKEKECFYIKGKLHGKSKEWYDNGFPKYEATYENGFAFGKEISWYENGKLHLVQPYQNFIPHGKWIEYSSEGKVLVEKNYSNGQIIGDVINYYENGVIREKIPYKLFQENGRNTSLLHGIHFTYYSNGKIQSSTTYARGMPYGSLTIFFENGNMERELFVFGALDKYALLREFDKNGQIRREGTYEVSEKDSMQFKKLIVTSYHENGNLHYRANHSKGRAMGAFESFYENGNLLSEAYIFKPANDEYMYIDNLGVAWQAIYYPNGALRYELFTLPYAKHGQFIEWFPDGKLKRFIDLNGLDIQWLQDGSLMSYQVYNNHNNLSRDTVLSEYWLNQLYAELNASPRRQMGLLKQGDGIQSSYYALNKKRMETHLKDGKFDQYFLVYNYTEDTLVYFELQNGILHGRYIVKNVNGTLHTSGFYDAGKEIGEWKIHGVRGLPQKYFAYDPNSQSERPYLYEFSFYETGAPERRTFYNNGRAHGWELSFHPNGLIRDSIYYQNDTLNGKYVSYTDEGKLYSLKYYEKGKRHGLSQDWFYKKDGKGLMREEFYVADQRHGLAKYYNKNGSLQLLAFFKNGIEDSTWIYYDTTGEVSDTVIYENGKKKEVPLTGKCACKDKSPSKGFAQSLSSLLSDETDFSLWEFPFHESVAPILDHCFFRNLQTDANQRSAFYSFELLTNKPIKVGIPNKNAIKLWLNPCLHDAEESTLDLGVSFTQRQPQETRVQIGSDRMAYVLPPGMFKPVKEAKQSLLAQFKVPYLSYSVEGINFENAEAICMDDAYLLHSNYLLKIDTFTVLNIEPNQGNFESINVNFYRYPFIAQEVEKALGNNPIILNNGRGEMQLKHGNNAIVAEVDNLLLANNLVAGFLTIEQVEAEDAILFYKEGDSKIRIDEKALYAQMKRDGFSKIIGEYNPEKKALEILFYIHKP